MSIALALTFVVFLPSLRNGFVGLDDPLYVVHNPAIKGFTAENVMVVLTQPFLSTYLPVTMLSYMVDFQLFGLEPFGYHLTNVVFHLICTLLLFLVAERLAGSVFVAFITSILFGVHTLHVESVAWISERKDVLYGAGFLGALYLYLSHLKTGRLFSGYYWTALLVFILSALAKAQAVLLPVVLVLIDVVLKRDLRVKTLLAKIPFFVPALIIGLFAVVAQQRAGSILIVPDLVDRIFLACYALFNYLWRLVVPIGLSCLYPYPTSGDGHIDTKWVYATPLILLPTAWAAYRLARTSREILFGIVFFVVTIAPFLQLVPLGNALYADRYTYISSIGLFLAAAILFERRAEIRDRWRYVMVVAGLGYLGFLAANTFLRTQVWKNTVTLATDGIEKEPRAWILRVMRALAYEQQDDNRRALHDWDEAVKYAPGNSSTWIGRGNLRLRYLKDFAGAADDYSRVIELRPNSAEAYYARAEAFGNLGKLADALTDVERAIAIRPDLASAYVVRGVIHLRIEQPDAALRDLTRAIELNPQSGIAYFNRAVAYASKGDFISAYADVRNAKERGFAVDQNYMNELAVRSSNAQ